MRERNNKSGETENPRRLVAHWSYQLKFGDKTDRMRINPWLVNPSN
jgi:hypothetical protein